MTACYLRVDNETLDDATRYDSIAEAKACFRALALELDRYGQSCSGTLHLARNDDKLVEYPDFAVSLGRRGNVRIERC